MKHSIAKLIDRLYFLGWAIVVVGGILYINKIEAGVIVASIGGVLLTINYLLKFVYTEPQEEIDWSLAFPELAGFEPEEKKKDS